jgi:hypothetical protein
VSRWLSLLIFATMACAHTDAKDWPNPYRFPAQFYVEQSLQIRSLRGTKQLRAQLDRRGEIVTLVLVDPKSAMVLMKLQLIKDREPNVLYQAPILDKGIPIVKIAAAVQTLYETPAVPLRSSEYQVRGPGAQFLYTWEQLRGKEPCQFPEEIKLTFANERYDVTIDLLELDCSV